MLGTLAVSKGSVVWFPKEQPTGTNWGWGAFAKLMVDNAKKEPEKR